MESPKEQVKAVWKHYRKGAYCFMGAGALVLAVLVAVGQAVS